jgi:hypothetical protein
MTRALRRTNHENGRFRRHSVEPVFSVGVSDRSGEERIPRPHPHSGQWSTPLLRQQIDAVLRPEMVAIRSLISEAARGVRPNIPESISIPDDYVPVRPGNILRRKYHNEICCAARREAAHALIAEVQGTGVKGVSVDFEGGGEVTYASIATPEKRLSQAIAGLVCNEGCGRPMRGVSGPGGGAPCRIVQEISGDECSEADVLNHPLVFEARARVDDFCAANASVIGQLADLLVLNPGESIPGEVVTRMWQRHQEKRRQLETV